MGAGARQSATAAEGKITVCDQYYYKAKWGHAEEFLGFSKNHYPVLEKGDRACRMLKVSMTVPRYHTTEDGDGITASPSFSRVRDRQR